MKRSRSFACGSLSLQTDRTASSAAHDGSSTFEPDASAFRPIGNPKFATSGVPDFRLVAFGQSRIHSRPQLVRQLEVPSELMAVL